MQLDLAFQNCIVVLFRAFGDPRLHSCTIRIANLDSDLPTHIELISSAFKNMVDTSLYRLPLIGFQIVQSDYGFARCKKKPSTDFLSVTQHQERILLHFLFRLFRQQRRPAFRCNRFSSYTTGFLVLV